MKLEKYSLEMLRQARPVLSINETREIYAGAENIGGGYAILSYEEMLQVFGSVENMPGYALTNQDYEGHTNDPFYSNNMYNAFYLEPGIAGLDPDKDASLIGAINTILENYYHRTGTDDLDDLNSYMVSTGAGVIFSVSDSELPKRHYIIPIAALGEYAGRWGLEVSNNEDESSSNSSSSGMPTDMDNLCNSLAQDITRQMATMSHLSESSTELRNLRNEIYQALKSIGNFKSSDLTVYINTFGTSYSLAISHNKKGTILSQTINTAY